MLGSESNSKLPSKKLKLLQRYLKEYSFATVTCDLLDLILFTWSLKHVFESLINLRFSCLKQCDNLITVHISIYFIQRVLLCSLFE